MARKNEPTEEDPLRWREVTRQMIAALEAAVSEIRETVTGLAARVDGHEALVGVLGQRLDEIAAEIAALRADMQGADTALHERIDETQLRIDALTTAVNQIAGSDAQQTARIDETAALVTELTAKVADLADAHVIIQDDITALRATDVTLQTADTELRAADAALLGADVQIHERISGYHPEPPSSDSDWQERDDLMDSQGRPVLGFHFGGEGGVKSDPVKVAERLGRKIQFRTVYWQSLDFPAGRCRDLLTAGTIPRVAWLLVHSLGDAGEPMWRDGVPIWRRLGNGEYDNVLVPVLRGMHQLGRPIFFSPGHESDMTTEQASYPKGCQEWRCRAGEWRDFAYMWRHLRELGHEHAPMVKFFWNMSGGFNGAMERWDQMWPGDEYVDFAGPDPYNQYGKGGSTTWHTFEQRIKMFGRWDWLKSRNVPIMVGETATCEGPDPGGERDGGKWILDMIDFVTANRWKGYGQGGGFSHLTYFSHHYAHCRCVDDAPPHPRGTGQRERVLPIVGVDGRLAWAA